MRFQDASNRQLCVEMAGGNRRWTECIGKHGTCAQFSKPGMPARYKLRANLQTPLAQLNRTGCLELEGSSVSFGRRPIRRRPIAPATSRCLIQKLAAGKNNFLCIHKSTRFLVASSLTLRRRLQVDNGDWGESFKGGGMGIRRTGSSGSVAPLRRTSSADSVSETYMKMQMVDGAVRGSGHQGGRGTWSSTRVRSPVARSPVPRTLSRAGSPGNIHEPCSTFNLESDVLLNTIESHAGC